TVGILRKVRPVQLERQQTASEWMARFFGGYFGRDRLGDPSLPISSWLDDFLFRLLSWPGCSMPLKSKIPLPISGIDEIQRICHDRHEYLESGRGPASKVMILYEGVDRLPVRAKSFDESIRVCIAQTVRPTPTTEGVISDWDVTDPEFNRPLVRYRHRRHLAAILAGISQMLVVRDTHRDHGHRLDWLILPELSVHPLDVRPLI